MGLRRTLFRTEDEANRRVFAGLHPMLAGVVEVEVHLTRVRVAELANFQVRKEQAMQTAVEEDQIDAEPIIVDAQPALAANECKIVAQLQQKIGKVLDGASFWKRA